MKVAIPTFGTRVSPRFDCAPGVLLVTDEDASALEHQEFTASGWGPRERIHRLIEAGVDTVICGGIDRWSTESLQSAGITVYAWVTGEVDDALAALLRGDLDTGVAVGVGGRCRCRCFPGDNVTNGRPGIERGAKRRAGGNRGTGRARGGSGRGGPTGPGR